MFAEIAMGALAFGAIGGTTALLFYDKGNKDVRTINEVFEANRVQAVIANRTYRPKHKKTIKQSYGNDYVYWLPNGVTFERCESCVTAIQDALNTNVEMTKEKFLTITIFHKPLSHYIPFDVELLNEPNKHMIVPIGKDQRGEIVWYDFEGAFPHLLIAGTTGGGKSSLLRILITWLAVKGKADLYLMDMKGGVEFIHFVDLPSVRGFADNLNKGLKMLHHLEKEMAVRYERMKEKREVNYRSLNFHPIVFFIDEMAQLNTKNNSDSKEVKGLKRAIKQSLALLGAKGRGSGIFLVNATQRPSYEVIDGLIKANLTSTIAFPVRSSLESRIILDNVRASELEKIAGRSVVQQHEEKVIQSFFMSLEQCKKIILPYEKEGQVIEQYDNKPQPTKKRKPQSSDIEVLR